VRCDVLDEGRQGDPGDCLGGPEDSHAGGHRGGIAEDSTEHGAARGQSQQWQRKAANTENLPVGTQHGVSSEEVNPAPHPGADGSQIRRCTRRLAANRWRVYRWQFGHQNLSRSWPGGPASPRLIAVPQRRHGRPARPYTQFSRPGLVSPVVT
jgi:hypothetical protein